MDPFNRSRELYDDGTPNLPLVAVRGVKDGDVWKCFERYNIQFNPPSDAERRLCEVIIALEEALEESERTATRLRSRPQA